MSAQHGYYRHLPDDPRIDTYNQDSGYCPNCGEHLDSGRCECTDEEIERAQEQ
jgi:hypothetical protein